MATYVISDIHGHYERFINLLNKINISDNDMVYILGDVIDRGNDGIKILQFLMSKNNFTLLLGNHEKMMLDYLSHRNDINVDVIYEQRWMMNGCTPTLLSYELLKEHEKRAIVSYLENAPVVISDLIINNKMYYLVHGAPYESIKSGTLYYNSDLFKIIDMNNLLWNRVSKFDKPLNDRTVIFGHTMTRNYQDSLPYSVWHDNKTIESSHFINIDCGMAANNEHSRLCALCLDTLIAYYE